MNKTILFLVFYLIYLASSGFEDSYVKWPFDAYQSSWVQNLTRIDSNGQVPTKNPSELITDEPPNMQKLLLSILKRRESNDSYLEGATFTFWLILMLVIFFQILAFMFFVIGCLKKKPYTCATLSKKKYICFRIFKICFFVLFCCCGGYFLFTALKTTSKYYYALDSQCDEIKPLFKSIDKFKSDLFVGVKDIPKKIDKLSTSLATLLHKARELQVQVDSTEDFNNFQSECDHIKNDIKNVKKSLPKIQMPPEFNEYKPTIMLYIWICGISLFVTMLLIYLFRIGTALNIKHCFTFVIGGIRALLWIGIALIFFMLGTGLIIFADVCANSKPVLLTIAEKTNFKHEVFDVPFELKAITEYYINCPENTNLPLVDDVSVKAKEAIEKLKGKKQKLDATYESKINELEHEPQEVIRKDLAPQKKQLDDNFQDLITSFENFCTDKDNKMSKLTNCNYLRQKNQPFGRALSIGDELCKVHTETGATIILMLIFLLLCDWTLIFIALFSACCTIKRKADESNKQNIQGGEEPGNNSPDAIEIKLKPPLFEDAGSYYPEAYGEEGIVSNETEEEKEKFYQNSGRYYKEFHEYELELVTSLGDVLSPSFEKAINTKLPLENNKEVVLAGKLEEVVPTVGNFEKTLPAGEVYENTGGENSVENYEDAQEKFKHCQKMVQILKNHNCGESLMTQMCK